MEIYYKEPILKPAYEELLNEIIYELEKGVVPWNQTWSTMMPISFSSNQPYTGINILALLTFAKKNGFKSPYWLTDYYARKKGGRIKKDEINNGTSVIQAKWELRKRRSKNGNHYMKAWLMMKTTKVYNLDQTERITDNITVDQLSLWGTSATAENVIENCNDKPRTIHDYGKAYYVPCDDYIAIPKRSQFISTDEYYSTYFHELIHSTGHPKRLNRSMFVKAIKNNKDNYAKEELVAELGAAFLCAQCGIINSTLKESVSYIDSWLFSLRNDKTLLFTAASQAQKAVSFILNKQPDIEEVERYESESLGETKFDKDIRWD